MSVKYLESGDKLQAGDLVDIWHVARGELGTVKLLSAETPTIWSAIGTDGKQHCHLRWARGKNEGVALDIVERSPENGRWVKAHDDWMWGRAARRVQSE